MAEEMWTVSEALWENGPGELCGKISVRVHPGESEDVLKLRAERNGEKGVLKV